MHTIRLTDWLHAISVSPPPLLAHLHQVLAGAMSKSILGAVNSAISYNAEPLRRGSSVKGNGDGRDNGQGGDITADIGSGEGGGGAVGQEGGAEGLPPPPRPPPPPPPKGSRSPHSFRRK
jgi:hypothetical protein